MREIKFRGKRLDGYGWVEGYLIELFTAKGILQRYAIETCLSSNYEVISIDVYEVISETIGQYIRREDRNGQLYCEGDIIRYTDNNGIDRIILFESIEDLFFHPEWEFILSKYSKIIGNKHENPELLGEVK